MKKKVVEFARRQNINFKDRMLKEAKWSLDTEINILLENMVSSIRKVVTYVFKKWKEK